MAWALLSRSAEPAAAHAHALPLCVPAGHGEFMFMLLCILAEQDAQLRKTLPPLGASNQVDAVQQEPWRLHGETLAPSQVGQVLFGI